MTKEKYQDDIKIGDIVYHLEFVRLVNPVNKTTIYMAEVAELRIGKEEIFVGTRKIYENGLYRQIMFPYSMVYRTLEAAKLDIIDTLKAEIKEIILCKPTND